MTLRQACSQGAVEMVLVFSLPEQFRRMTLLAGEEGDPGHRGIGGKRKRKSDARRASAREHRIAAKIKRHVSADVRCAEARRFGMGVGAVQGQHRHSFAGSQKILIVSGEAEVAGRRRRHRRHIGDGQQFQKIVPEHRQAVAGSKGMDAGRRQGKAEPLPTQRGLC
jgi:hypothetical protein